MNELNKRFKQYRVSLNVTQDELSQKSGVSVYTIKKFENGSDIRVSTLDKLLYSLGKKNVFDELLPDMTNRPSYRVKMNNNKIKQRAYKTKTSIEWKWGN